MDSIEVTDQQSAAVAVAPRVRLEDIEAYIDSVHYCTGANITDDPADRILTLCLLKMKNGFIVIGKVAPVSPENYNTQLGQKFAYEDAVRQLWPLMAFSLKDHLMEGSI